MPNLPGQRGPELEQSEANVAEHAAFGKDEDQHSKKTETSMDENGVPGASAGSGFFINDQKLGIHAVALRY